MSGLRSKGLREAGNPTFVFSSLTFLGGPAILHLDQELVEATPSSAQVG